jgi:hypothetical protein
MEIIDEIRHLSPGERARVIRFVRELERPMTGDELNELAGNLVGETDLTRIRELQERILAGFYGEKRDA